VRAARYVGRFAPTPSGDLHLGSLYTAAASYLDARANCGLWLLRIEDLDAPRAVPGASERIIATLQRFGFEWDGEIVRQRNRIEHYRAALQTLRDRGLTFECTCSRSQLEDEQSYPGTCARSLGSRVRIAQRVCASTRTSSASRTRFKAAFARMSPPRSAT